MNRVQKWGWNISLPESVPSVHLKWCQTSEQSELINANKDNIFIIISDSQKWRKIRSDLWLAKTLSWPKSLILFSGTQQTYSNNSLELITWYRNNIITCHRHQFRVDRPFDKKTFEKTVWFLWKFEIISKIGRFWRENVLIPSF